MKKQTKTLTLNKKTISNLTAAEMNKHVGGSWLQGTCPSCRDDVCGNTKNAKSCPGHKTCQ